MGLLQGFKSVFVGDEDIEEEIYSTYTPTPKPEPEMNAADPMAYSDTNVEPVIRGGAYEDNIPSSKKRQDQQRKAQSRANTYSTSYSADRKASARSNSTSRAARTAAPAYEPEEKDNRYKSASEGRRNNERESDVSMATRSQSSFDLVLARPNGFKEVTKIGEDINNGRTVILNLELLKPEDSQRIIDFIWGVAFANDAEIKMMAQKTYAVIPPDVNFSGVDLVSELENNGYNF